MEISKTITHGTVCTWKGKKLIRAGKRTKLSKIAGIWQMGSPFTVITKEDEVVRGQRLEGLYIKGSVDVQVKKEGEVND